MTTHVCLVLRLQGISSTAPSCLHSMVLIGYWNNLTSTLLLHLLDTTLIHLFLLSLHVCCNHLYNGSKWQNVLNENMKMHTSFCSFMANKITN